MVKQKRNGFTLMEMMVVLTIFSIVMGIAYTAIMLNDTYRDLVLTKIQLYRQNKKALGNIYQELYTSTSSRFTITDSNHSIRFQIPWTVAASQSWSVLWGADNQTGFFIRYRLVNNNLRRDILNPVLTPVAGTETTVAEHITNLQFNWTVPADLLLDVNCDGKVDAADYEAVNKRTGAKLGDANWDPKFDLWVDGIINIVDVLMYKGKLGLPANPIRITIRGERRTSRGWTIRENLVSAVFLRN